MNGRLLVAFALFLASPAQALEPPSTLTLADALTLALERHETPRIAAARIDRAEATRREALSLLFPTLTVIGTYKRAPEVIVETGGSERLIQRQDALNAQALLEARVVDLAAFAAYDRIRLEERAITLTERDVERRFAFEVAESFFTVLAAEELLRAAEQRATLALTASEEAKTRFGAGLTDSATTTRAELEHESARAAVEMARGALAVARAGLSSLVGFPVQSLAAPAPSPVRPVTIGDDELDDRPDAASARLLTLAAEKGIREPWLTLLPTLSVRANASATNETGFIGQTNWSVAATLSWALYDGGLRYARAAARSAILDEARASENLVRRTAALEVEVANARLSSAIAAQDAIERQSILARKNADEIAHRFRAGLATALEQVDASSAAFLAESEAARHQLNLRVAQLALLQALGQWPGEIGVP